MGIYGSIILWLKASSGTCQSARGPRKGGKHALPPMGFPVVFEAVDQSVRDETQI